VLKPFRGAGGTTSLNRKTRKINVLRVFVLKVGMELVMDLAVIYEVADN
jgi:hypothetical protein